MNNPARSSPHGPRKDAQTGSIPANSNFLNYLSSDARMRLLSVAFEYLGEAVLITDSLLDLPGPRILYVNRAMVRMSGYKPHELIGQTPRILQGEKTREESRKAIRQALTTGNECRIEIWNHQRSGKPYLIELFITPLYDANGQITHFVSIQRDITERHLAQIALEQSQQRLQAETQALSRLDDATSR